MSFKQAGCKILTNLSAEILILSLKIFIIILSMNDNELKIS